MKGLETDIEKILKKVVYTQNSDNKNIDKQKKVRCQRENMMRNIIQSIRKELKHVINLSMLFVKRNLFGQIFAIFVKKHASLMGIMRIIPSHLRLFGCVLNAIFITITAIEFTVIDLAKRLRKEMQKSGLVTKALEGDPKRFPRLRNKVIEVTGFRTNDAWILNLRATLA